MMKKLIKFLLVALLFISIKVSAQYPIYGDLVVYGKGEFRKYVTVEDSLVADYVKSDSSYSISIVGDSATITKILATIIQSTYIQTDSIKMGKIIINDSIVTLMYSGVIPDTTEVSKMIEDKKIDCENLHAYIDAVNNGVIDCENAFLSLTASSNQADVSYQWNGSVSGDMGTSNPLVAAIAETITLTVTNNTTSCETTEDIEITYDTITPTFEKFISSNIAGELVLSAFVTNQQDSTEYSYTWSETGSGIQTDVHGQSIKVNAAGIYYIQISNKNTGCDSTEFIVIYESDFETRFSKLISTNGDIVFKESSVGDHNIIKTDISEGPTALSIYDKAFADTMYNLTWRGIELKYPAINFDFLGYDNNIAVLSISDQYSVSVDSVLFIPTRYCSLTDGSPTDADFSNCKVITHGSGESITLVKDNDGLGNGDNYIVSYNGTNYKWVKLDNGVITDIELSARTIYVDSLNGDDITGDGSISTPFQSIKRALEDVKSFIAADITIQIDTFQNEFNYSEISALTRMLTLTNGASLIFKGTTKNYATLALTQDGNLSTLYTFTGATLSDNEVRGMFIVKNTNNHYPISENDDDSLWTCDITAAGTRTIYQNMTTIINSESNQAWLELPINNIMGGVIKFENINFDDNNRFNFTYGNSKIFFYRCNFDQPFNIDVVGAPATGSQRIDFGQCYIGISTSSLFSRVRTNKGGHVEIRDCVFNELSGSEIGLFVQSSESVDLAGVIFNDSYLKITAGSIIKITKSITLKDLTDGIIVQANAIMEGNEVNSEFILNNVTNFFTYGDGNQFDNIITGGFVDLEGYFTNLFTEIPGYQALENYTINLPGLWQKNERIITDITNNTSGNIEIGDTLQNKAIYIDYSITRQDSTEIGTIVVSGKNDTDISDVMDITFDDAEITFSKNVSGSTIRLGYVLSDATYDAELNLNIKRMMR